MANDELCASYSQLPTDLCISSEIPDWTREQPNRFWDPGRRLLRVIRRYQHWSSKSGPLAALMKRRWVLSHCFWSVVTGADIPLNCQIEGGLLIPHPNGIVIHPGAKIGPNCLIFQQVTIGTSSPKNGCPILVGHVDVGAGAKILGPVTIGEHARIGANAVVLHDVAQHSIAVGVPAKAARSDQEC
jgi:serine O-acetyltransferase